MPKIAKEVLIDVQSFTFNPLPSVIRVFEERGKPTMLKLDSGNLIASTCVVCSEQACMYIDVPEKVFAPLRNTQSETLCPNNAISMSEKGVVIIEKDCVNCGLCATACPIGAIYFDENIHKVAADYKYYKVAEAPIHLSEFEIQRFFTDQDPEKRLRGIIQAILDKPNRKDIVNKTVTKSLQLTGIPSYMGRVGDVNLRMKSIGRIGQDYALVEIDFQGNLDGPRDILDDIAVFCSRFDVPIDQVIGLIVLAELPNSRTEYWELISDINTVLGVKIATIPLASLLLCAWNHVPLDINGFLLSDKNMSARTATEAMLQQKVMLPDPCNLIEAAK